MRAKRGVIINFFSNLKRVFYGDKDRPKESDRDNKSLTLAFNALDKQHQALSKLEYFIMTHHAYLIEITKDFGEYEREVEGFYFSHISLLNELKESCELIEAGLKR